LLVKAQIFKELSGLDPQFYPAWFEDVDFCKQIANKKLLTAICHNARVFHQGGSSLSSLKGSQFLIYWYSNLFRYTKKHFSPFEYLILRLLSPFTLLPRALFSARYGKAELTPKTYFQDFLTIMKTSFKPF
jgi:GT2 family glycosyltransferase